MEAHAGKIRVFEPGWTLPTVYFRIAARGPPRTSRAPALERVIARADGPSSVVSWRTEAFRAIAAENTAPPPIALAQLRASGNTESCAWVAMATPVHLVAGMSNVHLPADGILEIDALEADTLTADFNRSFGGGSARLVRGLGSGLLCVFDAPVAADTIPPEEAVGGDMFANQPRGEGSAALRRLSSEIEMWLFDHAVNVARRTRGLPVINALWLWGGGGGDSPLPRVAGWTAGDDVLFSTFDRQSQYPAMGGRGAGDPGAGSSGAGGSGPSRSGVVVLSAWPGTAAWQESEQRWLSPALDDLKAGRLCRIEMSAASTSFSVNARALRRFWRRSRAWWEAFGLDAIADEGTRRGD
jgi:hypothetical protein